MKRQPTNPQAAHPSPIQRPIKQDKNVRLVRDTAGYARHRLRVGPWQRVVLVTLLCAPGALGQGVVRDSISAIPSGRGGTNIAHHDNLTLILDNPAGLVNLKESQRFDWSLDILLTDLDYRDPLNDANGKVTPFPIPSFAYARKSEDKRWAYGFGFFAPAGFGAKYKLNHFLYGKRNYRSLGALIKILPALSYKVNDRLSLGATFGLAISHAKLKMPFAKQTGFLAGLPGILDLKATGLAPTWSLGMQYELSKDTTLGLSFISETRFHLKGPTTFDVSGFGLPLLRSSYDAKVDLVWPRSVGAGITHRIDKKQRISADLIWFDWSHAFDDLSLELTNGSNKLFDLILGPKVRDKFPLDWKDSIAIRAGYEYSPNDRETYRAGYIYHPNPIPNATLMPLLTGTLEHVISVGYGRKLSTWKMDLAYQFSWGPSNHVSSSNIVGGFNNSTVKAQAHWFFMTFSRSF